MAIQMITVSSKGQVVLPADMREELSITIGTKLAAFCSDGMIVLKPVILPKEQEFLKAMDAAKEWAAEAGYTESDVAALVKRARKEK